MKTYRLHKETASIIENKPIPKGYEQHFIVAVDKEELDKLHEQWREKWQQALDSRDGLNETIYSLEAKLEKVSKEVDDLGKSVGACNSWEEFMSSVEDIEENLREILDSKNNVHASPTPANNSQWQPIETAPKDGTALLLYTFSGHVLGRWFQSVKDGWWVAFNTMPIIAVTHWMPLPVSPGQDQHRAQPGESK